MNVQSRANIINSLCPPEVIGNKERSRINCYAVLVVSDIAIITISFLSANFLHLDYLFAVHGITMLTVIAPFYLWVCTISGAYSGSALADPRAGAFKAVKALVFAAAITLILAYAFKVGATFSRLVFSTGSIFSAGLIFAVRPVLGRKLLKAIGGTPFSTVVVDDGMDWPTGSQDMVLRAKDIGFDPRTDDPLHFHRLAKLIAHADRVLIACPDDRAAPWSQVLKSMAVDGEILSPDVDRMGVIGVSRYNNWHTLIVSAGPLHLKDRMLKRIFDVIMSSVALVLLSPILIGVAAAIRLESAGPILFRQQRIGRDNTLFFMLKFRSMYQDKCDEAASVLTGRFDSRVTRVGKFIRRNSLDELPQLINVLRGDMSVVGPRPHALSARAAEQLYWEIDERYRHRHAVKPGVTGLAQIRGYRGATMSTTDLTNRLSSDLEYLRDWSIGKDLWILFRTIFVIRHDNAF